MKIAVFSDVHGNFKALKAALEQIKEKDVFKTVSFNQRKTVVCRNIICNPYCIAKREFI